MAIDLRQLSDACVALYAPGLSPENFATRAYDFLRKLVPVEMIACGILRDNMLDIGFDRDHPDLAAAMEALGKLMGKYDLYNWNPRVNNGRPFCRSHFFTARQFRNLDLYSEVYRPLGIDNHCAVYVPTEAGEVMFFGLERDGGPDFSGDELEVMDLARAQLANAHALGRSQANPECNVTPELLRRAGLTPREGETLFWISQGKSNPEISMLMRIQLHTVKAHVASIFNKSGVGNRLAATLWARDTCAKLRQADQRFLKIAAKL